MTVSRSPAVRFIIIALGESIVVTGATAVDAGLSATVVLCVGVAFLQTAALWWLYLPRHINPNRKEAQHEDRGHRWQRARR